MALDPDPGDPITYGSYGSGLGSGSGTHRYFTLEVANTVHFSLVTSLKKFLVTYKFLL